MFTRHALPGEEVVVEITEGTEGDRFWRGDAMVYPDRLPKTGRGALPAGPVPTSAAAATSSTSRSRPSES